MSLLPYNKGKQTYFINLLFSVIRKVAFSNTKSHCKSIPFGKVAFSNTKSLQQVIPFGNHRFSENGEDALDKNVYTYGEFYHSEMTGLSDYRLPVVR